MIISGQAEFPDASVAEKVRLLRADGGIVEDLVPDPGGGYSFTVPDVGPYYVVISAISQRALAHGPVNAV